ncbi:MAG: hypothetical protein R2745_22125 [Vicinamibacterales bacterium]
MRPVRWFFTCLALAATTAALAGPSVACRRSEPAGSPATVSPAPATPLQQAAATFDGGFPEREIKARLDQAMPLYGLTPSPDTYRQAVGTLVSLRKANGVGEMAILDYMIQSHVPGVALSFPEAATVAAEFLKHPDR